MVNIPSSRLALRRLSVVDEVVAAIREQVLDLELPPATSLTEDHVAEMYDISRVTARAAVTALVTEGLLRRDPNRPAQVPLLSARDVRDLFRVRRPVELEAVRLITRKDLRVPEAAYVAARALAETDGQPQHTVVEANIGFHRALVAGVNNAPLARCFAALEGELQLALSQSGVVRDAPCAAREHKELLDVLERHKWVAARDAMLAHLRASAVAIVQAIEASAARDEGTTQPERDDRPASPRRAADRQ